MHLSRQKFGAVVRVARFAALLSLSLAAAFLFGARPAAADTVDIFGVSGIFTDGTSVAGTITIDVTDGLITAANVLYGGKTYSDILSQGAFFGGTNPGKTPVPVDYVVDLGTTSSSLPRIDFGIDGTSLIDSLLGYAGGNLASVDDPGGPDQQGTSWVSSFHAANGANPFLESGTLVNKGPVTAPEPSTALLLGIAFLGIVLSLRKLPRARQLAA